MTATSNLDTRYGRAPNRGTRDRRVLYVTAGSLAAILVAFVVWVGLGASEPLIETRDIGHTIVDENLVTVTFEASIPVGRSSSCAVQALNETFTVVGWTVIDLPASPIYSRSTTTDVRTTEQSNTGLIYRCWLT
ncbi:MULTISPECIES: DUF4307 domain-containing protein [Cryobacterium]|uniref:DUF4307 domain-containing protein n=1 Tax=Cryobacterium breve TaxID=1259258 RepID=A0ABY2J367_9MICO|nr:MULTISPECIES: DUF4307 domain-containing protein [Cryobacterium]TFC90986.1 DUF4307 domain-containing protein [Cryobacterium sp. TmT3-12]TFC99305.1 DUF4307 domain-containing protein [Cryobacterium breve]